MPSFDSLLAETLEAWRDAREGVIAELRNIPDKQLDFRPEAGARSVRELAQHILEVAMMMTGELTRPDTNLQRAPWPRLLAMYAKPAWRAKSRARLLALLRSQQRAGEKKFLKAGELHLLQLITRFDGELGTRLAWLNHGIAHEMYHRGQLALYARLMGRTPALTKAIAGEG